MKMLSLSSGRLQQLAMEFRDNKCADDEQGAWQCVGIGIVDRTFDRVTSGAWTGQYRAERKLQVGRHWTIICPSEIAKAADTCGTLWSSLEFTMLASKLRDFGHTIFPKQTKSQNVFSDQAAVSYISRGLFSCIIFGPPTQLSWQ